MTGLLFGSPTSGFGQSLLKEQNLPLDRTLQIIAFGSCNREDAPQRYWTQIMAKEPDLWIWLGDNIYADTEDMRSMREQYLQLKTNPNYTAFRRRVPITGIWDDHDYGVNDGGKEYEMRASSQALFFDFIDEPKDAAARKSPGIYRSYVFGPEGKRVKVILLDTRYFRDGLEKNTVGQKRYQPNPTGDVLGAAQWQWLEEELRANEADIHLIASSIQVIPEEQGFEKWANFPSARQRLFDLLTATQPNRPILISGDRHLAELSRIELPGLATPLYEFTSSGLTHSYEAADEPNRHRVSDLVGQRNFGILSIDWDGDRPRIISCLHSVRDGREFWAIPIE